MAFVVDIIILIFPCVVTCFGLMAYAGRRANTTIGQGLLFATDYARAALAMILIILELTNLLHNPAGSRTVLDVQYGNITVASYFAM